MRPAFQPSPVRWPIHGRSPQIADWATMRNSHPAIPAAMVMPKILYMTARIMGGIGARWAVGPVGSIYGLANCPSVTSDMAIASSSQSALGRSASVGIRVRKNNRTAEGDDEDAEARSPWKARGRSTARVQDMRLLWTIDSPALS